MWRISRNKRRKAAKILLYLLLYIYTVQSIYITKQFSFLNRFWGVKSLIKHSKRKPNGLD